MSEVDIKFLLTCPDYKKALNWTGIEFLCNFPRGRIKQIIVDNYTANVMIAFELVAINKVFENYLDEQPNQNGLKNKFSTEIARRLFNWRGVEQTLNLTPGVIKSVILSDSIHHFDPITTRKLNIYIDLFLGKFNNY